jgi:hypothetical protein
MVMLAVVMKHQKMMTSLLSSELILVLFSHIELKMLTKVM